MDLGREEGRHSCIIYIFDLFAFIMHMQNSFITEAEALKRVTESEEGHDSFYMYIKARKGSFYMYINDSFYMYIKVSHFNHYVHTLLV